MRALRRKIMVVVAVSTVAVAVLVLARSLPFASGSTSPAATGHSGVRNVGAGTAMGALNRLPVKGKAPMTGYARARFGRAWTDDADQGFDQPVGPQRMRHSQRCPRPRPRPGPHKTRIAVCNCVWKTSRPLHRVHTRLAARTTHLDNSPNRPRRSPRERMDYRRAKTLTAATHRPGQRPVELAGCRRTR